jgi:hypothetical protein
MHAQPRQVDEMMLNPLELRQLESDPRARHGSLL